MVIQPMRRSCTTNCSRPSETNSYLGKRYCVPVPTLFSPASSHRCLHNGPGTIRQMTSPLLRTCFSPTRSNWLPPARSVRARARLGRRASPPGQTTTRSLRVLLPRVGRTSTVRRPRAGAQECEATGPRARSPHRSPPGSLRHSAVSTRRAGWPAVEEGRTRGRSAAPVTARGGGRGSRRRSAATPQTPPRWLRRATLCARATGGGGHLRTLRRGNWGGGVHGCPLVRCRASA